MAFLAGLPGAAGAVDAQGLYVGGGGGLVFHRDSSLFLPPVNRSADVDWRTGFAAVGAVGYAFPGGPRAELELGYRQNRGTFRASPVRTVSDTMRSYTVMANAYYDFDTESAITPYIGGGIGVALNDMGPRDVAFAYQGIAGMAFAVNDRLDAFIDYRFVGTAKTAYRGSDISNQGHVGLLGVRYSFGNEVAEAPAVPTPMPRGPRPIYVPPPAEPPPAATAPTAMATSYLVFFDFDQATLTTEGQRIVRTAAVNAREAAVTRIDVTGHTDRAGSNAYNAQLSRRRAEAVKRELVANGVRDRDIVIYAKGETQPLVPTPDGVRDQQNRRVEIMLN